MSALTVTLTPDHQATFNNANGVLAYTTLISKEFMRVPRSTRMRFQEFPTGLWSVSFGSPTQTVMDIRYMESDYPALRSDLALWWAIRRVRRDT
jgi:hypothetical protein